MSDKKGISKVGAGLLGTAVGVAVGAAAVALSDKKTRDKAIKKAKEFQKTAEKTVDDMREKAQGLVDKVEEVKDEFLGEESVDESSGAKPAQTKKDEKKEE